ncbi:hypothetical protein PMSD_04970 [Paenibacillus macquariensis subsp. defensor]|nr:hypothetical protein PMSD_04970 [Paenibacillus macquariensis subsp. defensor]
MNHLTIVFFRQSRILFIINLLIFLSLPMYTIIRSRFIDFSDVYYFIYFTVLFSFVFLQSSKISDGITTKKQKIYNYIIIPFTAHTVINLIGSIVMNSILSDKNPQNLQSSITLQELFEQMISDFYTGSEEVWRFATISILCVMLSKIAFKRSVILHISILTLAILISSFIFGWLHTFGYSSSWFDFNITVTLTTTGLCFALLLIVTKNIWTVVITHILFNVSTSLGMYNMNLLLIWSQVSLLIVGLIGIHYLVKSRKPIFIRKVIEKISGSKGM